MSLQYALPGIATLRPKQSDRAVIERAVLRKLKELAAWAEEGPSDVLSSQVVTALERAGSGDGYRIARELERSSGWAPDSTLVELLDDLSCCVSDAHSNAVKEWVEANNIVLPLPEGTEVLVPHLAHVSRGPWKIVKHMPEIATYGVSFPGLKATSCYYSEVERTTAVSPVSTAEEVAQ